MRILQPIRDLITWYKLYWPLGKKRHEQIEREVAERTALLDEIDKRSKKEKMPVAVLSIGIGTGDSGQYLELDVQDRWWVSDHNKMIGIQLSNPYGLMRVLQERQERGEI